ncbi:MAG TPA: Ku protein [Solirubrobacterales bacterium]|jgi:DNA end-binding protein Ku|nr:Ku protein [Solirubrobacterales bacterium]
MARAIWSGSISFGLLNVPVRMYSAVARRNIALREIRESDSARIKHRRFAEGTDEEVPYDEIIKAYELTPGQYVPLTKEEMEALAPEKTRAIDVSDFVDLDEIDPMYFDSPYYLGPADGAEKAYGLLAKAMAASGKVAIARFVLRNKEHLAAIRSNGDVLTLTTMRFADEVVPAKELEIVPEKAQKPAKREQEMAEQLIDSLSTDFDPSAYHDEYREQLLKLIERKAEGKEIVASDVESPKATKAPDLMAALEESIAAAQGKGAKPKAKSKTSRQKTAAKAKKAPAKAAGKAKSSAKAKKGSRAKAKAK